jgi:2-oxoglutarate ferredoxin oxidoreductase subunit beta
MDVWKGSVTPISTDHDTHNRSKAIELAMETEKPFVGLFYHEERQTMDQAAHHLVQQAKEFDLNRYMARYS